ncbi:MAG: TOBE domain-containing protein, partial [Rhodospirillales bacterium]|nr:TOBE domain-containing protein [Rhodospirillales bacterium]
NRFRIDGTAIAPVDAPSRGGLVLGVRPEDLKLTAAGEGDFHAPVYASELTGESVLVTVEVGGNRIAAKADRRVHHEIGERVGIGVDASRIYLFDAASGERLRAG